MIPSKSHSYLCDCLGRLLAVLVIQKVDFSVFIVKVLFLFCFRNILLLFYAPLLSYFSVFIAYNLARFLCLELILVGDLLFIENHFMLFISLQFLIRQRCSVKILMLPMWIKNRVFLIPILANVD